MYRGDIVTLCSSVWQDPVAVFTDIRNAGINPYVSGQEMPGEFPVHEYSSLLALHRAGGTMWS